MATRPHRRPRRPYLAAPRKPVNVIPKVNIIPDPAPSGGPFSIECHYDGMCNVVAAGQVVATGLTKSTAWAMIDRLDQASIQMEEKRRRIGDA
jgi:hypothetical protein